MELNGTFSCTLNLIDGMWNRFVLDICLIGSIVENDGIIIPKIKISENTEKITNPGYKKVYRLIEQIRIIIARNENNFNFARLTGEKKIFIEYGQID